MIDLHNLPKNLQEVEQQINLMGKDEVFQLVHMARNIAADGNTPTDEQTRVGVMAVRKLRSLRENSTSKTKAAKAAPPPMVDLMSLLKPSS